MSKFAECRSSLEIRSFRCRLLPSSGLQNWVQHTRSETVDDDLDPVFATKAVMSYRFRDLQRIRFEVYDEDIPSADLSSADKLGMAEVTLKSIVKAGEKGIHAPLQAFEDKEDKRVSGEIVLVGEELIPSGPGKDMLVSLKLGGSSLASWSGVCPPKTFWSLSKYLKRSDKWILLHRSKDGRGSNPSWVPLQINYRYLCNGDIKRHLKIGVFQRNFTGKVCQIGETYTSLGDLMSRNVKSQEEALLQLVSPDGAAIKGSVRLYSCTMEPVYTFSEFMQCGLEITPIFAVDFTCSNGESVDLESLHFVPQGAVKRPNSYETAIEASGSVIMGTNREQMFALYGFGAQIPPYGEVSHCFNVNLRESSPLVEGVDGMLEAYKTCLGKINLYAPTYFAPVINNVARRASKIKPGVEYIILVILSDGVISDMAETKKAIVAASSYPMSIIIIGVGEADFGLMEELDGDAVRLNHRGKKAARDIVQFVPYRNAQSWLNLTGEQTVKGMDKWNNHGAAITEVVDEVRQKRRGKHKTTTNNNDYNLNKIAHGVLAREMFEELPAQITSYMKSHNIKPIKAPKKVQTKQE